MKALKYILLFSIFFGILSCEDPISIEFPETEKNLVLNSLIKTGDTINAFISESQPYSELENPESLKEGNLDLYQEGVWISKGRLCKTEQLPDGYRDSTYTFCFDHVAEVNQHYKIVASTSKFDPIEGSTIVPPSAKLKNVIPFGGNSVQFSIEDDPQKENFYFFTISYSDSLNIQEPFDVAIDVPDLTIEMIGFSDEIIDFPSGENIGVAGFFDDKSFNGGTKIIAARTAFTSGSGVYSLNLFSCSEAYYQYYRTSIRVSLNNNGLFSNPVDVFSNISNGFGIVGSVWDTTVSLFN